MSFRAHIAVRPFFLMRQPSLTLLYVTGESDLGELVSGFAAAQCGKALPYRQTSKSNRRLRLPVGRSLEEKMNRRKGGAFPHCAAAKPLYRAPGSGFSSHYHPFGSAQVALSTPPPLRERLLVATIADSF